jgi:hypothetical protein
MIHIIEQIQHHQHHQNMTIDQQVQQGGDEIDMYL